jgi:hypothetical protein
MIGSHHPVRLGQTGVPHRSASAIESLCLIRAKRLDRMFAVMLYETLRQVS